MKNTSIFIAFLAGLAFVTASFAQPESNIATPAEKTEITQSAPDLEQKQNEDWQRLREERKIARQQILLEIKASVQSEIKNVQQEIAQQKAKNNIDNKEPAKEGFIDYDKGLHGKGHNEWEKNKNEILPFDSPHPNEYAPFYKGPQN